MFGFFKSLFSSNEPSPQEIKEKIAQGAVVVDVRNESEWQQGHLPEAKLLPLPELQAQLSQLESWCGGDKNTEIVVYCASGMRSSRARKILQNAGFSQVYNGGALANLR